MAKLWIRFPVLLGSIVALASACADLSPVSPPSELARSQWLKALPQAMSDEFCNQSSPLRGCYPELKSDCEAKVAKETVSCVKRFRSQIPDEMAREDMSEWGKQIGVCTNDKMFRLTDANSVNCQNALKSM